MPLMALVQQRSNPEHMSRVIAGNNIINALLMVLSAILAIVMLSAGYSISELFLVVSICDCRFVVNVSVIIIDITLKISDKFGHHL